MLVEGIAVIAELTFAPAIFDAGRERVALTREQRGAAARLVAALLRLDVDDATGRIAVARGKYAGEKVDLLDEFGIDHREKGRIGIDVERHQNAVDLILELRAFGVADVDLLVLVDGDAGHLREHIGERGIGAGRQIGDVGGGGAVVAGAARRKARPALAYGRHHDGFDGLRRDGPGQGFRYGKTAAGQQCRCCHRPKSARQGYAFTYPFHRTPK